MIKESILSINRGIALVFFTLLMDTIGIAIVAPILPTLLRDITGGTIAEASVSGSWLVVAYAIAQFLCAPFIGSLSDKFGRRPVLLISIFTLGLDNLICAFAKDYSILLIGRILSGMSGASFTTCMAYIADVSTNKDRVKNFSIIEIAFGIGFIIGPSLGGILGNQSIRFPFFFAAFLAFINFILSYFLLPETLPKKSRRSFEWKKINPITGIFVLKKFPMIIGIVAVDFFYALSFNVWPNQWAYISTFRYGWNEMYVGLSYTIFAVGQILVIVFILPHLSRKVSEKQLALIGLSMLTISFIGYAFSTTYWMVLLVYILTVFEALMPAPLRALSAEKVPVNSQGEVQGAMASIRSLTVVLSPPLYAFIFEYFSNPRAKIIFLGAPFILAFFFSLTSLLLFLAFVYRKN